VRPGRAADHSPPSSAAVVEEYSYNSTHPLGHTGPVTGSIYLYIYVYIYIYIYMCVCVCVCVCVYSWNMLHCCLDVVNKMELNHLKINN
jgi:hypothetical protein